MTDNTTEIELKYDAKTVEMERFVIEARTLLEDWNENALQPKPNLRQVEGLGQIDTFYRNKTSGFVVRFRRNGNGQALGTGKPAELTLKVRSSEHSLLNRKEYDLFVTNPADVHEFMMATGHEELFSLTKDFVVVEGPVPIEDELAPVEFSWYTAKLCNRDGTEITERKVGDRFGKVPEPVTFIEVEAKKGRLPIDLAMEVVGVAGRVLSSNLGLGGPINVSLFEHFARQL